MRYTRESYYNHLMELLPESNFTLDVFTGTEEPSEITCNICHKHYYFAQAGRIARRARRGNKNVCKTCENNKWTKLQRDAEIKAKRMLQEKGTIELVSNFTTWGSDKNAIWHCTKCNHDFERSPKSMFTCGFLYCPWCETRPHEYDTLMIKQKAEEMWGDEYSFLDMDQLKNKNGSKRVLVKHNKCGFKYSVSLWNFLHGQGCPKCKKSHGERKVRKYLEANNISFTEQKHTLIEDSYLIFDFYIETRTGRKFVIEYNGIQHYQPVSYFGGEEGFIAQQKRDKAKERYCKDNNIELIIIPHYDESLLNSNELAQRLSD